MNKIVNISKRLVTNQVNSTRMKVTRNTMPLRKEIIGFQIDITFLKNNITGLQKEITELKNENIGLKNNLDNFKSDTNNDIIWLYGFICIGSVCSVLTLNK
jgi:hypothetical protein